MLKAKCRELGVTQHCLRVHSRFLAPSFYLYSNSAFRASHQKRSEEFSMNKQKAVRQKIKIKKSPQSLSSSFGVWEDQRGRACPGPVCQCVLGQVLATSGQWSVGHRSLQTTPSCLQAPALPLPPPRRLWVKGGHTEGVIGMGSCSWGGNPCPPWEP